MPFGSVNGLIILTMPAILANNYIYISENNIFIDISHRVIIREGEGFLLFILAFGFYLFYFIF